MTGNQIQDIATTSTSILVQKFYCMICGNLNCKSCLEIDETTIQQFLQKSNIEIMSDQSETIINDNFISSNSLKSINPNFTKSLQIGAKFDPDILVKNVIQGLTEEH